MPTKPNRTVCGIPVSTGGVIKYDLHGNFVSDPNRVALGSFVNISNPAAKRLAEALGIKVPKRGTTVQICDKQYLERDQYADQYRVRRDGSGEIKGARRRRRK